MLKIRLLLFASLKERAGYNQAELEIAEGASIASLKKTLGEQNPALAPLLGSALASINQVFAFDEDLIPDHAEVGFFPPVSGGAQEEFPTIYQITNAPIDLDELVKRITLPTTGAACLFTGMVRAVTRRGGAHETAYLEYEAYVAMAEAKMSQVAQEIRVRWPTVEGIVLVQRIGRLAPGTPTVLIACTAAHRDTGVFEAARYGIDRLKEIVPVWKKEVSPDGEEWVEGEYQPGRGD